MAAWPHTTHTPYSSTPASLGSARCPTLLQLGRRYMYKYMHNKYIHSAMLYVCDLLTAKHSLIKF